MQIKDKMLKSRSPKGFSLLELTLVLLILGVVMGAVFNALNNGQKTFDSELANAQAQENARYAIDRISEIIQTAGNNPQTIIALNGLSFVTLYDGFNPTTQTGTIQTIPPACGGTTGVACPMGKALRLLSDFDGDAATTSDVGSTVAGNTLFSSYTITSENIVIFLDTNTNLVNFYNFNPAQGQPLPAGGTAPAQGDPSRSVAIAEFVTDLNFVVDSLQNQVTISVTARSNRAVAIESVYEKRFRYASFTSVVKLRNRG